MTLRRGLVVPAVAVVLAVAALVVWTMTGGEEFWPRWVWFGLGAALIALALAGRIRRTPAGRRRWLVADGALLVFLSPVEITVWLLSGQGFFWPVYSLVTMSVVFGAHVWFVARRPDPRERELSARVDTLTRTRRGAVDSQAAELRRIERDLHDGAQARMVSTALNIGIAQSLLRTDPAQASRILDDARTAATGALQDLRGVMQGIYPSVLSDRGLGGAVRALVYDLVIPVRVDGDPPGNLPAAAQAAMYFAVSECLANAVKHGQAERGWVEFRTARGRLVAVVGDDGVGGASTAGGTGLLGITERLAAFDGTLDVHSPAGGPTVVTLTVPLEDQPA
ncbi:sensor histidine kinase [Amycolatopsis samaneae]|uniref:histidine kinase n=1 Tax=Amycolatopsis samaneae TaxID=664691 RepID=A0ABW5G823_9PSEU